MKAKDIALLCTAAAGAGAAAGAAGAALTSAQTSGTQKKAQQKAQPATKSKKSPEKPASRENAPKPKTIEKLRAAEIVRVDTDSSPRLVCSDNDHRSAAVIYGAEKDCRAYMLSEVTDEASQNIQVQEFRCPTGVIGAEVSESGMFFITDKGGVMVYSDKSKEPVFCGLTDPEYICSMNGKFHIFSDCLMYVCGSSGEIEKTVSLGALIEITGSDICDAENTDGGFSAAEVSVKKCLPLGKASFAAVITEDHRSFLMHSEDGDFYSFEKTYEDIYDVCVFGGFAYYLCGLKEGYGIIKTKITDKKCETVAKYTLCGKENLPVKLYGGLFGIGVLYADGTVKFLLPEIASEKKREKCRRELKILSTAFENIHAQDIFTLGEGTAYLSNGEIFAVK